MVSVASPLRSMASLALDDWLILSIHPLLNWLSVHFEHSVIVSLCSQGWPWTHCRLGRPWSSDPPASSPCILWLQTSSTMRDLGSAGNWTQSLMPGRQAMYKLIYILNLLLARFLRYSSPRTDYKENIVRLSRNSEFQVFIKNQIVT